MPSRETTTPAVFLKQLDGSIATVAKEVEVSKEIVAEKEQFLQNLKVARETVAKDIILTASRPRANGNGSGNRTQMLKTILANAPQPVTVDEILAELAKHGRTDERRLVYSTLSYLRRAGLAKPAERGRWVAVSEETAQAA